MLFGTASTLHSQKQQESLSVEGQPPAFKPVCGWEGGSPCMTRFKGTSLNISRGEELEGSEPEVGAPFMVRLD